MHAKKCGIVFPVIHCLLICLDSPCICAHSTFHSKDIHACSSSSEGGKRYRARIMKHDGGQCRSSLASQPYVSIFPLGGARRREKYVWTLWPASRGCLH